MQIGAVLLTNVPSDGNTTVFTKAVEAFKAMVLSVGGIISREERKAMRGGLRNNKYKYRRPRVAGERNQRSGPQVGKYYVKMKDLENVGAKAIAEVIEKCAIVAIDKRYFSLPNSIKM